MTLDKRLPAVYVEVEDRSLADSTLEAGRSGYVVILSDRGPHNKVVELNSRRDLYDIFGSPDFMKYGQGHYLADKFLTYSSRLYVVRPCLLEPINSVTTEQEYMSISNVKILINTTEDNTIVVEDEFTFTTGEQIVILESHTRSYNREFLDSTSIVELTVGDWIYPDEVSSEFMRQIVAIDKITTRDDQTYEYEIMLDAPYNGPSGTYDVRIFSPVQVDTQKNLRDIKNLDIQDENVLWYISAIGAGKYYDKIFIKGVRNVELERMYTGDDGEILFPNMFMDIGVYRRNDDNTISMLEGPWPVSLVDRLPGGQIIRDVFSGQQLYFPTVVNQKSKIIKCIDGAGAHKLMSLSVSETITYPNDRDTNTRLAVQTIFAQGYVFGSKAKGGGGFFLKSGENGSLYSDTGMLNFVGNENYEALVAQSYNGSLKSVDGSIELIVQDVYPRYLFDYILAGGYNAMIQNSARELCDKRNDCLLLGDPGYSITPDEDLDKRLSEVPWNTWNAALYAPYREIYDTNTGKRFMITPVYHAIENHLQVDSKYWIAEPVAGIEKAAIQEPIELAYKANVTKLGDLIDVEINPTIVEPDGIYFLTQFSTWKRLSVLKRLHVVKFVHYLKKRIPKLLKDILQRKASNYWVNQCDLRINGLMNLFLDTNSSERFIAITSYKTIVNFDDVRSEINVSLTIEPIRAIERIHVNILVI